MNRRFFARRGGGQWREPSPPSETGSPEGNQDNRLTHLTTHRRFTARRGGRASKHHHHVRSESSQEKSRDIKGSQTDLTYKPPPQESESDRNKREADVRVSAELVKRFTKEGHLGRIPPDPSVLPAEFRCIHCLRVVKREENLHPWVC
ncbi:hypothetical protein F4679DRAFT_359407 [Xylaria curta]|nr:hypothetical protein F4679DRAFT_359407 [Xylaria curta]